jgi:DNA polymerase-4
VSVRKILHIDMDAFYAAVEQRDRPELRGRPVIVGGDPHSRGVVATCSYEARRFGVRSAMPAARARQLCPEGVFLRPRFPVYRAISEEVFAILRRYTPWVEPLALDEAYLDVTAHTAEAGSATALAGGIRQAIQDTTGLVASAGVSYNKMLAKLACEEAKPAGLGVIPPRRGEAFVAALPVGRLPGVGPATEARLQALGITTGEDLRAWSRGALESEFGRPGASYFHMARARDERPVVVERERKSLGTEQTFPRDLNDRVAIHEALVTLADAIVGTAAERGLSARTVVLKVKYNDFEQVTRRASRSTPITERDAMRRLLGLLVRRTDAGRRPVRLLGVALTNLSQRSLQSGQPELFDDPILGNVMDFE